jgi:NAD(P)-dependent dehydrogenase (short-subunit alcohol dehydrogenase family)
VNVVGAYQMIRAARSLLEAAPQAGAVVNTASIAGVVGIGTSVPYAASKGALITMTLSLARALAPKIRVNAICPGFIDTPILDPLPPIIRLLGERQTPMGRLGEPREIAAVALFLASDDASFVTGQWLSPNGGLLTV